MNHTYVQSHAYVFQGGYGSPSGFDRTRNVEIGNKNIVLHHLEEAYTSEHWLVRIYRFVTVTTNEFIFNYHNYANNIMLLECIQIWQ